MTHASSFFGIPDATTAPPSLSITFSLAHLVLILLIWTVCILPSAQGWKECQGGGVCPDYATCCPSTMPGSPPACISTRHGKDPLNATGICCDDTTGCPYGFSCAVRMPDTVLLVSGGTWMNDEEEESKGDSKAFHKREEEDRHPTYCKIDTENPPVDLFHDQPRYQMCRIPDPSMMTTMHGFSIQPKKSRRRESSWSVADAYQLAYYSSHGDLMQWNSTINDNEDQENHDTLTASKIIEKVLIIIHGSGRTAEDYFCVGLSLVPEAERDRVLVIAPKFLAPVDLPTANNASFLIWQEDEDPKYPMAHSWRYGADALNAPISSYGAIDRLVEYLLSSASRINSRDRQQRRFPNLKQVSVAGHSAGGQVVHRWALLSKIPHRNQDVEIRIVAANPRSYCYLDGKRMIHHKATNITRWEYPPAHEVQHCFDYNQWNWGLESGGALDPVVPYFVRRLKEITTPEELTKEYARRKVFYLTGEYDVIEQKDHCATFELQGTNRHERAVHYFAALKAYVEEHHPDMEQLNHDLHTIPESPHDHVLMFQSAAGRKALLGESLSEMGVWSIK